MVPEKGKEGSEFGCRNHITSRMGRLVGVRDDASDRGTVGEFDADPTTLFFTLPALLPVTRIPARGGSNHDSTAFDPEAQIRRELVEVQSPDPRIAYSGAIRCI